MTTCVAQCPINDPPACKPSQLAQMMGFYPLSSTFTVNVVVPGKAMTWLILIHMHVHVLVCHAKRTCLGQKAKGAEGGVISESCENRHTVYPHLA